VTQLAFQELTQVVDHLAITSLVDFPDTGGAAQFDIVI
jgi:hypothetical protein